MSLFRPTPLRPRLLPLALALACIMATQAAAQPVESTLPQMGSSAGELISPGDEQRYARQMLGEMRNLGLLEEDPLLVDYIQDLGGRLAANSAAPGRSFTFFLMRSRAINAFATLAGHVGINAGLILTAEREDELAAVLGHEITHVTQQHLVRGAESAQKDSLPIALAMLAAVIAANQAGDSGDATQAVITGGIALMQQRQINFTRANEHEADRIGIQILARSGFDPMAMADFFGRMQRADRSRASQDIPEMLRSHPVTSHRITEAKDRAAKARELHQPDIALSAAPLNPALPSALRNGLPSAGPEPGQRFAFVRERLRVLSADSTATAVAEYRRRVDAGEQLNAAERYGYALAQARLGRTAEALQALTALRQQHANLFWIDLAIAETEHQSGNADQADHLYAELIAAQPGNRAVSLSYANALAERGNPAFGRQAQEVLRPLLAKGLDDAALQHAFARACELAGDLVRAGEAHAEAAFLRGRAEDALNQLERLKQAHTLDYVQRARIDARIAAMTPIVLELRAEGIHPGDPQRRIDNSLVDRPR